MYRWFLQFSLVYECAHTLINGNFEQKQEQVYANKSLVRGGCRKDGEGKNGLILR
ncbi:hypothetical protein Hanom_Chr09g00825741 [Helianthus anomalus]